MEEGCLNLTCGGVTARVDLWQAHTHMKDLADRYRKRPEEEYYAAVANFLVELGFPPVSQLVAARFAGLVIKQVATIRASVTGRADARLARFYGLNPFALTPAQKLVLQSHMDPIWAEEVLRDRGGSLSSDSLRVITLLATGDEDKADDAWARRRLDETPLR